MKEESIKINFKNIKEIFNNIFSKIYDFFSYRDNIAFCIFIILLIFIHQYFNISQETGVLFFLILVFLFLMYFFIFNLQQTENFLIKNITLILGIGIFILIGYQREFGIENKDIFIMIGAIFAFWYGYKKYEQDKYLYHLEKLISKNYYVDPIENIQKFGVLFYAKNDGRIPKDIWHHIERDFWRNLKIRINFYLDKELNILTKSAESGIDKIIEKSEIKKSSKSDIHHLTEIESLMRSIDNFQDDFKKSNKKDIEKIINKLSKVFAELFNGFKKEDIEYIIDNFSKLVNRDSEEPIDRIFTEIYDSINQNYSKLNP